MHRRAAWASDAPSGSGGLFLASNMCAAIVQLAGKPGSLLSRSHFLGEGECVMPGHEMSNREAYRQKALHCLRAADKVHNSGERVALLSLASNYMTLADYVAGHDARTAHRDDKHPCTQNGS